MEEEFNKYLKELYYPLTHYFKEITYMSKYNTLDNFILEAKNIFKTKNLQKTKDNVDLVILSNLSNYLNYGINYKARKNKYFGDMLENYPEIYQISKYLISKLGQEKSVFARKYNLSLPDNFTLNNCKVIAIDFFKNISNNDKEIITKVIDSLNNLKINESIPKSNIKDNKITLNNNPAKLTDLINLICEISHVIRNDKETMPCLKEIESLLTEKYFINYLLANNIKCIKNKDTCKNLTKEDIDNLDKKRIEHNLDISKRVIDELDFLMLFNEKNTVDVDLLNEYATRFYDSNKINLFDKIKDASKIKEISEHYYNKKPGFKYERYNFIDKFDPENNEQLSYEAKFIYGEIISQYIINLNQNNLYLKYMKSNITNLDDIYKLLGINKFKYKNKNEIIKEICKPLIDRYREFNLLNYNYIDELNSLLEAKENIIDIYKLNNEDGSVIIKK